MLVSIVLFFFIQVDNVAEKVILRILLMPVVAGISYEIIRLPDARIMCLLRSCLLPVCGSNV